MTAARARSADAPGPDGPPGRDGPAIWRDALLAATLVAIDPHSLGGVLIRARPGPVREAWREALAALLPPGTPLRRLPPGIGDGRLLGGLDLGATLAAGRPVAAQGLLAEADGGLIVLPMAERAEPGLVARLGMALDTGRVRASREGIELDQPARIGLVAFDEGAEPEEAAAPALTDRLAFHLDFTQLSHRDLGAPAFGVEAVAAARARLAATALATGTVEALTKAAAAAGLSSFRPAQQAVAAARAAAALFAEAEAGDEAARLAARLVIAPRALRLPDEMPEEAPPPDTPPEDTPPEESEDRQETDRALEDRVLDAVRSAIPADLLARLAEGARRGPAGQTGRQGAERMAADRGRPLAPRPGRPEGNRRLDLIDTLRAAAPWQPLRRRETGVGRGRPLIRAEDFRIRRFRRHAESATVFIVDASGSAALARLAEAKGAVEIMLADSYRRRDQVALVAFRGTEAEVLLPPTRAPALARRRLQGLPGGGGTPLARGLMAGLEIALACRRRGLEPRIVLLTDARANIDAAGQPGRAQAREDAETAAAGIRGAGVPGLLLDTGTRPSPQASALAAAMGALYLAMPRADARALARAASAVG